MQVTEDQVKMAAELYNIRDKARRLLGDQYKPHMAELGKILKTVADEGGKSELSAAIDICNARKFIGMDSLLVMAAVVELAEPSP